MNGIQENRMSIPVQNANQHYGMKKKEKLTYEKLHEGLNYNPDTGIFLWKVNINRGILCGMVAGYIRLDGYITIGIYGKKYLAQRLAWLYVHGYLPENDIDHKDQIRHHNWILNLREASGMCNMQNQKISSANSSGITGVRWDKIIKKWKVQITKNKKQFHLGLFNNKFDAAKARYAGEQKYFTCVVKSSALKFIQSNNLLRKPE